jgi:hypothetical protein
MKHYAIERWVDFSRDLVESKERSQMQGHLVLGCGECRQLAQLTLRLTQTCAAIAVAQVPESTLRLARAIFPVRAQDRPRRGSRLPIELIFDSFLAPAPAGLRATWQVGWQGLYKAGECSLDLRIEPELKSARAAVIGQVTNHVAPSTEMGNLPITLRSGNHVVAETVSNRFGEFQMEYEQKSRLQLVVHLHDAKTIQIPLKKLISDQPAAKSRISSKKR